MKKLFNRFMVISLATVMFVALGATACFKKPSRVLNYDELNITFYDGGYGRDWAYALAEKFEMENEGVTVNVFPDPTLDANVQGYLTSGCEYDIIFCHNYSFEPFAIEGFIENLDDLYSSEVEPGVTFEDRIKPFALKSALYDGSYYKVPWTLGTGGIAYSQDVMDRVNAATGKNYDGENMDYLQFVNYCKDIYDSKLPVDATKPYNASTNPYIVPMGWASGEVWFWDYIIHEWWAQLAGLDVLDNFTHFDNMDIYNPNVGANNGNNWSGFRQAYTLWYNIFVENKQWTDVYADKVSNQSSFVNGKTAMIPAANWMESETKGSSANEDFVMRIMSAPMIKNVPYQGDTSFGEQANMVLDAKKDAEGNYIKVSYTVSYGDNVVIPTPTKTFPINTELAKKFLLWMSKEENALLFTEKSGGTLLPYEYDYTKIENPTPFQADLYRINLESQKFTFFTQAPLMLSSGIRGSSTTSVVWPENEMYYTYSYTATAGMTTPREVFNYIWGSIITPQWDRWEREAGLK